MGCRWLLMSEPRYVVDRYVNMNYKMIKIYVEIYQRTESCFKQSIMTRQNCNGIKQRSMYNGSRLKKLKLKQNHTEIDTINQPITE